MIIIFLLRPPAFLSIRLGDLLTFNNLLVSVIYLIIDNIKGIILTEKKEDIGLVVLMWSEWQRMDFNVEIKKRFRTRRTPVTFSPHKNNQYAEVFPMPAKSRSIMLQYNNNINATGRSVRFFTLAHKILEDIPYIMIQGCLPLRSSNILSWRGRHQREPPKYHVDQQKEAAKELIQGKYFDKIHVKQIVNIHNPHFHSCSHRGPLVLS